MKGNVLILRKYILKYLEVKGHDVLNNFKWLKNLVKCVCVCVCVCGDRENTKNKVKGKKINNWWIFIKSIQKFFVLILQLCKFEISK